MKKKIQILISLTLLFLLLVTYNNCQGGKRTNYNSTIQGNTIIEEGSISESNSPINEPIKNNLIPSKFETTTVNISSSEDETSFYGVRNRESLLKSMSLVTGVPYIYEVQRSDGTIIQNYNPKILDYYGPAGYTNKGVYRGGIYNEVYGNLPIYNSIDKFNYSSLNSIFTVSQTFCDELMNGIHPLLGEDYFSLFNRSPNGDVLFEGINNVNPTVDDINSLVEFFLNKIVPDVDVNDSGKNILKNSLQSLVDNFVSVRSTIVGFFSSHGDVNNISKNIPVSFRFYENNPIVDVNLDFSESWFLSFWIMPNNYIDGIGLQGGYIEFPNLFLSLGNVTLLIDFSYSGHNINGKLTMTDYVQGAKVRYFNFIINNAALNKLKSNPYHFVFQFESKESSEINMMEDFQLYINNERYKFSSANWSNSNPVTSSTDFYNPSLRNSSNPLRIDFRGNLDLLIGHIEIIKGKFKDYSNNPDLEIFLDINGEFTFPKNVQDVNLRDSVMYFGVGLDESNDILIKFKNSSLDINHENNRFVYNNITRTNNVYYGKDNYLKNYDRESWEYPLVKFSPLICSTILSSQYFIFY